MLQAVQRCRLWASAPGAARLVFSPLSTFLIEGVLGSKNLFSESCLERPNNHMPIPFIDKKLGCAADPLPPLLDNVKNFVVF